MPTIPNVGSGLDGLIELTGSQASYIALSADLKDQTCKIPDFNDEELLLPDVELPEILKQCAPAFVELPVLVEPFPPPENCNDGLTFNTKEVSIFSSVSAASPAGSITFGIDHSLDSFCEYDFVIPPLVIPCYPGGPKITGSARINVTDLNTSLSSTTEIKLTPTEGQDCTWDLGGIVDLVIPEIPCPDGIAFNPGSYSIHSTIASVAPQQRIAQITRGSEECEYDIRLPDITIPCYPHGPHVHGDAQFSITDRGEVTSTQVAGFTNPGTAFTNVCDFRLGGDVVIEIPCQDGITVADHVFNIRASSQATAYPQTIGVHKAEDICNFNVVFPDLIVPCYPDGPVFSGSVHFNTLDGSVGEIDFGAVRDPEQPCRWDLAGINIDLPIPSCGGGISYSSQNLHILANAGLEIPHVAADDIEGRRRYQTLSLHQVVSSDPENRDCGAVLDGTINLGLPNFVTQCTAMGVGQNQVTFTFNPALATPSVIGLRALSDGCGFEFSDPTVNLPVLACDGDNPYAIDTNWEVFVGSTKVPSNLNTARLVPSHPSSPHCGLVLTGELHLPDFVSQVSESFSYFSWSFGGALNGADSGGEPYPKGALVSVVHPEGDRCSYQVVADAGAEPGLAPTSPDARSVYQGVGCTGPKVFAPFKVIKTRWPGDNENTPDRENVVKVVPNSRLYRDIGKNASLQVRGLDTAFRLNASEYVWLECTFDSTGNDIVFSDACIASGPAWDSTAVNPLNDGEADVPGVFDQRYKVLTAKQASILLLQTYNEIQIDKFVGLSPSLDANGQTITDLLKISHTDLLTRLAAVKDARPRQFKAYALIAMSYPQVAEDAGDREVDEVVLKKNGKFFGVHQALKDHLVLVSKNVNNVPLVTLEPFPGANHPGLDRLFRPHLNIQVNDVEFVLSFTSGIFKDPFGEWRSVGVNSGDIHIYYTTDGSTPTINVQENPKCFLYTGSPASISSLDDCVGDFAFMAVSDYFLRSATVYYSLLGQNRPSDSSYVTVS